MHNIIVIKEMHTTNTIRLYSHLVERLKLKLTMPSVDEDVEEWEFCYTTDWNVKWNALEKSLAFFFLKLYLSCNPFTLLLLTQKQ